MKTKKLPILKDPVKYYEAIESEILKIFRREIYAPLIKVFGKKLIKNSASKDPLVAAVQSAEIYYDDGQFRGQFSSETSKAIRKLGGKFNHLTRGYEIKISQIPIEVQQAISLSAHAFDLTLKKANLQISQILQKKIGQKFDNSKLFDRAIFAMNKRIEKSIDTITVAPQFTKQSREKLSREYTENLQKYIQDFSEEEIIKLRQMIEKITLDGGRYEEIAEMIQQRFSSVSESKAKFLARQESRLMMSKFKESRYSDVGVKKYIWTTVVGSPAHPVRPFHKKLDGTIRRWDNPPITDEKGNRNNPGEDYNCRCSARPILEFS